MALTLPKLQRLERAGLVKHFTDNEAMWTAQAKDAYDYIKKGFSGEKVRPDDVHAALLSIVDVDKPLRKHLDANRLSQRYYLLDFTSLVLDRTWDAISKGA